MAIGRKLGLTAEAANKIVSILQRGLTIADACSAALVSDRTFHNWMAQGEKAAKKHERNERASRKQTLTENETRLMQFWQLVSSARSIGKVSLLEQIHAAAAGNGPSSPPDWKAAAWLLERMHPREFGRKYIRIDGVGMEGAEGSPNPGASAPVVRITIEGGSVAHPPIVDDDEPAPE